MGRLVAVMMTRGRRGRTELRGGMTGETVRGGGRRRRAKRRGG
jgi:hypothetical protein